MRRLIIFVVVALVFSLVLVQSPLIAEDAHSEFESGKRCFQKGEYARSIRELNSALRLGLDGRKQTEAFEILGICYCELGIPDHAKLYFRKFLENAPTAALPPGRFSQQTYSTFSRIVAEFPVIVQFTIKVTDFKPYLGNALFSFTVTRGARLRFTVESHRKEILFTKHWSVESPKKREEFQWNGRTTAGVIIGSGTYYYTLTAIRDDGWNYSKRMVVELTSNYKNRESQALRQKIIKIQKLYGKKHILKIKGKYKERLIEEPKFLSWSSLLNYPLYGLVGFPRDAIDFCVKAPLSVPFLGQILTLSLPIGGYYGYYSTVRSAKNVYKSNYTDPYHGFDSKRYNSDKDALTMQSVGAAVLTLPGAVGGAAALSGLCWTFTSDGFMKGFISYGESNAFRQGFKSEYFFPNYRSLDLRLFRTDRPAVERLKKNVQRHNDYLGKLLIKKNTEIDNFNAEPFAQTKAKLTAKVTEELHKYITIKQGTKK